MSKTYPATIDHAAFEGLVQRMITKGSTPIALYGAGELVDRLHPTVHAPKGSIVGIIDDDPKKVGKTWAGLPVLELGDALASGVKGVIITSAGASFERIWAGRGRLREAGVYVLSFPQPFEDKGWDGTLIEQYEYSIAKSRGLNPLYNREYPPENPVAWEVLLRPLMEHVKPGMTVCEIGSGTGLWTQHLIDRTGTYHAVDYSGRLLFEAIEHRFSAHLGKLRLHHDERAMLEGIPDASVDLAFSMDVFVHFKSDLIHQFLESIARVLKPGGKALIHFVTWNERAHAIWRESHKPEMDGKYNIMFYTHMDHLRTSAKILGLKVEQVGPEFGWAFLAKFEKP